MLNEFQKRALSIASNLWKVMQDRLNTPRGQIIAEETYWYTHVPTNVPAAGTATVQIPIQADADFDAYYLSATGIQAGAIAASPYMLFQITDTGTGKTLFSTDLLVVLGAGTSGLPYILQNVRTFKMKSNIQITYTNPSATDTIMQTSFGGIKTFFAKD